MKKKFQDWWNEKYFFTNHPRYQLFRQVYDLGADLDYIDFLCDFFWIGDTLQIIARKKAESEGLLGKKKPSFSMPSSVLKPLRNFMTMYGMMVVPYVLEALKIHVLAAKTFEEQEFLRRWLELISPRVSSEARRIARDAYLGTYYLMLESGRKNQAATQKDRQTSMEKRERALKGFPLLPVLMEFNPQRIPRKGRRPDPWGSFFLLAVAEHLRETSGKPHYVLASLLLRKLRRGSESKIAAKVRVHELKKSHPAWANALGLARKQFRLGKRRRHP